MPGPGDARRRGRRGRRTAEMIRIARERVQDLFALAEREAGRSGEYSSRYVRLARSIGMRYNVRVPPELSEFYCRGCSTYWVEGRTVRTRLRAGRRVRTCLTCGRVRRTRLHRRVGEAVHPPTYLRTGTESGAVLVEPEGAEDDEMGADEGEDA